MNRIKEELDKKGIKQIWLAKQLGKSYPIVNAFVLNKRQPSLKDLHKMADLLDVDVRDLLISTK